MSRNPPYDPIDFRRDRSPPRRPDARDDGRYNNGQYSNHPNAPQRNNSISRNNSMGHARDDFRSDLPRNDLFSSSNREPAHREIPRGPKSTPYSRDVPREQTREPSRDFLSPRESSRDPPLGPRGNPYLGDNFRGNDFRGRASIRGSFAGRGRGYGGVYDDRDRLSDRDSSYRERDSLVGRYDARSDRGRPHDDRPRGGYRGVPRGSSPPAFGRGRGGTRGYDDPMRRMRGARSRSPPAPVSEMYDQRAVARRSSMVSPPPTAVDVPAFGAPTEIPTGPKIPTRYTPKPVVRRTPFPVPGSSTNSTPVETQFSRPLPVPAPKPLITGRQWALKKKRSRPVKSLGDGILVIEPLPNFVALQKPIVLDMEDSESESEDEEEFSDSYFQEGLDKIDGQLAQLKALRAANATLPFNAERWDAYEQEHKKTLGQALEATNDDASIPRRNIDRFAGPPSTPGLEKDIKVSTDESGSAIQSLESSFIPSAPVAPALRTKESTRAPAKETAAAARPAREKALAKELLPTETVEEPTLAVPYVRPTLVLMELPIHVSKSAVEDAKELEAVRRTIKTPPMSTLKYLSDSIDTSIWDHEYESPAPLLDQVTELARAFKTTAIDLEAKYAREWQQSYRDWLSHHESDDPLAIDNRERWNENKLERATPPLHTAVPVLESRTERRNMSRFATEHDLARVLEESKILAKATEEKEKRQTEEAALAAITKEAKIPDMISDNDKQFFQYQDNSGLISPDRAVTVFEAAPADLSFSDEEQKIFLKAIVDHPKKWSIIATHLPNRDYKDCIQFYYQVKHVYKFKALLSERKRGRKGVKAAAKVKRGIKPKANALTASMRDLADDENEDNEGDDKTEDNEAAPKNKAGRPRRAVTVLDKVNARNEVEGNNAPPAKRPRANKPQEMNPDGTVKIKKKRIPKDKAAITAKQGGGAEGVPLLPGQTRVTSNPKVRVEDKDKRQKSYTPVPPPQPRPVVDTQLASRILPGTMQIESAPYSVRPWNGNEQDSGRAIIDSRPMSGLPASDSFRPMAHAPGLVPPNLQSHAIPDVKSHPYNDRMDGPSGAPPRSMPIFSTTDQPQSQRLNNPTNTTSYWSVPETTEFPQLLAHFGTDWNAIAKHMQAKTAIMVYTSVFQSWLKLPDDSNRSRRITNIMNQVKNYYQRQVEGGRTEWERIAKDADARRARGDDMGPPPRPASSNSNIRKIQPPLRSSGLMEGGEEQHQPIHAMPMRGNSPMMTHGIGSPAVGPRYPVLAQAGTSNPILKKEMQSPAMFSEVLPSAIQQDPQQLGARGLRTQLQQQQALSEVRPPMPPSAGSKGPTMGYFARNDRHDRPAQGFPSHGSATPGTPFSQTPLTPAELHEIQHQETVRSTHIQVAAEKAEAERRTAIQRFMEEEKERNLRDQRDHSSDHGLHLSHNNMDDRARIIQERTDRERIERQRREEERHELSQSAWRPQETWQQHDRARPYDGTTRAHGESFAPFETRGRQNEADLQSGQNNRAYPNPTMESSQQVPPLYGSQPNVHSRASSIAPPWTSHDSIGARGAPAQSNSVQPRSAMLSDRGYSIAPSIRAEPPKASSTVHSPAPSVPRQPEKRSNIMSLLNDEPSEPPRAQSKPATPLPQAIHSPMPQQPYSAISRTRNSSISDSTYQPHHQQQAGQSKLRMQQSTPSHITSHPYPQSHQQTVPDTYYNSTPYAPKPAAQPAYTPRSYTPQSQEGYDGNGPYHLQSQMGHLQPRRDSSLNDQPQQHQPQQTRVVSNPQSGMRGLVESPYTAAANPVSRAQAASPHEHPRQMFEAPHDPWRGPRDAMSQQAKQQPSHHYSSSYNQQHPPPSQRHDSQSAYGPTGLARNGPTNADFRSNGQNIPHYMSEPTRGMERERDHQRIMGGLPMGNVEREREAWERDVREREARDAEVMYREDQRRRMYDRDNMGKDGRL